MNAEVVTIDASSGIDLGKVQTQAVEGLQEINKTCLLYTSDAADERSSVDLGGRRIIKKKKNKEYR